MTKQDILDYFNDINQAYNDSTRLDTLSNTIAINIVMQVLAWKIGYWLGRRKKCSS